VKNEIGRRSLRFEGHLLLEFSQLVRRSLFSEIPDSRQRQMERAMGIAYDTLRVFQTNTLF